MNVICFGDSNTFGHDPRSPLGTPYPPESRWVDLLAAATGWDVKNEGLNGRTIPLKAPAFPADTDLLIIMLGTNDLLHGAEPAEVLRRMENFLLTLSLDRERLLLLAPPPMQAGTWVEEERLISDANCLSEAYRQLAARLGIAFADPGRRGLELAFDGVHLTPDGHRTFAQRLFDSIHAGRCKA